MTQLLNLPGVIVEDSLQRDETLILSVRVALKTAVCPRCSQISYRLHQNRYHLIRDLSMGTYEVILRVNRRQFKCEYCKKPFSETLNFVESRKRFTNRYAQMITEQVIHSDVHNVAKKNRLTDEEVWSMVMAIAEKIMPIPVEKLRRLGIDEISLVKGQGKFIVVLVDLEIHKLIGLVPERKQAEIEKVMKKWGEEVLAEIEEVSIDMSGNYKSLVKKLCPNAEVTVDRFHVTKMVHEELNQHRVDQKKNGRSPKHEGKTEVIYGFERK